jgi:hypothetical protein
MMRRLLKARSDYGSAATAFREDAPSTYARVDESERADADLLSTGIDPRG